MKLLLLNMEKELTRLSTLVHLQTVIISLEWSFIGGLIRFYMIKISISLIFDNILDTNYRNYLNRLRFYADEMGRNVMLQIKINH